MLKTLLPVLIHRIVLLALGFVAAKYVFAADVANKLMAGDTVELWSGAPKIQIKDIENYLLLVGVPALISVGIASWSRMKLLYALIRARLSPKVLTNSEVKEIVAETSTKDIIQTVIEKP